MESKDKQPQPQPVTTPVVKTVVPTGPCTAQLKEYQECLDSFSSYFTGCKKEQESFKACPEFNTWLQEAAKKRLK